jgi:predicted DNA-binding transcriptional regulator YafY
MNQAVKAQEPVVRPARWGQERRLEFIDFRLQWDGRLNRGDLIAFFGISVPQASKDIARYGELAPGNLQYDASAKVYVATDQFRPMFATSSPSRYLSDLLASEIGVLEPDASFVGWRPPVAYVPTPSRALDADTLVLLLKAVRQGQGVRVLYQSMSRPRAIRRALTPHAFAHDGFRWHVRAYCHAREQFRDFVIPRMLELESAAPAGPGAALDSEWHTPVELVLRPNPKLSSAHQRAVELDYGMKNGEVTLSCRQALLFYVLRQLGLHADAIARPEAQQVVLKNRAKVERFLRVAERVSDGTEEG